MTSDNRYRCTAVDPNTGAMRLEAINSRGTVTITAHGLLTLVVGKIYHVHVDIGVWSGDHSLEIEEST